MSDQETTTTTASTQAPAAPPAIQTDEDLAPEITIERKPDGSRDGDLQENEETHRPALA